MSASTRGTIFLEEGRVLLHTAFEAHQFVIRIEAPKCAAHATPGTPAGSRSSIKLKDSGCTR